MTNEQCGGDTDRPSWSKLAECEECSWKFREHNYLRQRYDETGSKLDVSARQMAIHSRATGHAVRSLSTDTNQEVNDESP